MSTDKENLDFAKAEAFIKSPAGFWTVLVLLAAIAGSIVVTTIIGFFE